LTLFARIKGVPENEIAYIVNQLIDRLTLSEYADRVCGGYSGGNKRKLCVGLALIGHPPIVFLDEPSTGITHMRHLNCHISRSFERSC
jgi:ABC-type multidrug transport system ATPase subunit